MTNRLDPTDARTSAGEERRDVARDRVCRRLAREAGKFPDLGLGPLDLEGLSPRDAALTHAIYHAAVTHWLTLEFLLGRFLQTPIAELEPKMRGVLLAGSAQILFLDRVPAHAAVNHAVDWAKRVIRPKAGGMVNAVLRKVAGLRAGGGEPGAESAGAGIRAVYSDGRDEIPLSSGGALVLAEAVLPEDPLERLAVATSHPRALLEAWLRQFAPVEVRRLALHSLADPPVIVRVPEGAGLPEGLAVRHRIPGHAVFTGDHSALGGLLASRRDVWVQDPGSSRSLQLAAALQPRLVVDLCAGMGTKTRQLAAMFPAAEIVATDVDDRRRGILMETLRGAPRVRVVKPESLRLDLAQAADLVLLDVPCSNTGVLARRPEAKYRVDRGHLESLVATQRQIVADGMRMLRPGGRLLYATCSLQPEENDEQVAWIRKWHGLGVESRGLLLPEGDPGGEASAYSDGAFAAVLGSGS